MAFSCSYMLKRLRDTDEDNNQFNISSSVKPSADINCMTDVSPDAVDALNSILSEVCTLSPDKSNINDVLYLGSVSQNNPKDSASENDVPFLGHESADISQSNQKNSAYENDVPVLDHESESVSKNSLQNYTSEHAPISNESAHEDEDCQIIEESQSYDDTLDFKSVPVQITGAWSEFSSQTENNYTRGCKWAPDGTCVLTCSADNVLRIFNLPVELWDFSKWQDISEMTSVLKVSEGESVYDFCWYPSMASNDPATCCFASCSKNSTVHLWDAFTGDLRCSYRAYDQMDELTSTLSLSFDSDGGRIFCGYDKMVRVFNTDLPGRRCEERPTYVKKSGQMGIISCFAFTPSNRNISAVGSYGRTIGIYSEPGGSLECVLEGQRGGVTHLQFSPDGNLLYSGGRKDNDILCWDMRNLGEVLFCMRRSCSTNQRMYFDISRNGRYVTSGNNNGVISVWDTWKEANTEIEHDFSLLEPTQFFVAHNDCVNGVSINPSFPLLCSSSGQRKFRPLLPDDEEDMFASKTEKSDNSLRLWWIGKCS